MISREVLFKSSSIALPRLSPDGTQVAWIAESSSGQVLVVAAIQCLDQPKITECIPKGFRQFRWSYMPGTLIFVGDQGGNEFWQLYMVNVTTMTSKCLTPALPNVQTRIHTMSYQIPYKIIVAMNDRNFRYHDLLEMDLLSGTLTRFFVNDRYTAIFCDDFYTPKIAESMDENGGKFFWILNTDQSAECFFQVPLDSSLNTDFSALSKDGKFAWFIDSTIHDKAILVKRPLDVSMLDSPEIIQTSDRADIDRVIYDANQSPIAVSYTHERRHWLGLDQSTQAQIDVLTSQFHGDLEIIGQSENKETWLIAEHSGDYPIQYAIYQRQDNIIIPLLQNSDSNPKVPWSKMRSVTFYFKDNFPCVSYYSLPHWEPEHGGGPNEPLPTVLLVHGGPWRRDYWKFNSRHQWLANCGYAVLSPNFRGSAGFGKQFLNAGNGEWGKKMQDDLIEALDWAVQQGVTDPKRVAIMGGSYGGYAALQAVSTLPSVFSCAVAWAPISNLVSFTNNIPKYWEAMKAMFHSRIGDSSQEDVLLEQSPITYSHQVQCPVFLGHGYNDTRISCQESIQFFSRLKMHGKSAVLAVFPDEGHKLVKKVNLLTYYALVEQFLSQHLGGGFLGEINEEEKISSVRIFTS